jgi:hypothetical protein
VHDRHRALKKARYLSLKVTPPDPYHAYR